MWAGGVRVILRDEDNRILMLKQHHDGKDIWMPPGGKIEEGENSMEAAIREVKEETGLDINITGVAWHIEEVSPERGQRFVNYMIGDITGGELILGSDPELSESDQVITDIAFLSRDEIAEKEHVHPAFFNDEIWGILDEERNGMAYYKLREPWSLNSSEISE